MKFYTNKYPIVTCFEYKDGANVPVETIPEGTIFKILSISISGFLLEPIDKNVDMKGLSEYHPEMIKIGFTESDYIN